MGALENRVMYDELKRRWLLISMSLKSAWMRLFSWMPSRSSRVLPIPPSWLFGRVFGTNPFSLICRNFVVSSWILFILIVLVIILVD